MDTGSSHDFESRAREAGERFAAAAAQAEGIARGRDLATDTDRFHLPFSWKIALQKSVFPFVVGVGSVAAAAGLDWVLATEDWKSRVAPYAVPVITAAATYARNYLKQQAKIVKEKV